MDQSPDELNKAPVPSADGSEFARFYLPVVLLELLMTGIMLGVYALLGRWSGAVLAGGLVGAVLTLLNLLALVIFLRRIDPSETPKRGQALAGGMSSARLLVLFVILVLLFRTGKFAPVATLLPLCFMRIALYAAPAFAAISAKIRKKENP